MGKMQCTFDDKLCSFKTILNVLYILHASLTRKGLVAAITEVSVTQRILAAEKEKLYSIALAQRLYFNSQLQTKSGSSDGPTFVNMEYLMTEAV